MSDTGAKGRSTTDEDEFSEITQTVKRVDCLWAHGARSEKSAIRGGKDRSRAGNCNISKKLKSEKKRQLLVGPRLRLGKMRHVGQSKRETDRFDHANPYHVDFDISNSLCR